MQELVKTIFFGNYFIGCIAVALSIECCVQLHLPLSSIIYYIILFSVAVFYYTYAYVGALNAGENINPRKLWYSNNHLFISWSQRILFSVCIILGAWFLYRNFAAIAALHFYYWLAVIVILFAGMFYYGLLPAFKFRLNLRNTGWLKAFVIGFVWACCANILPVIITQIERGTSHVEIIFLIWLFVKNWMFCTVNAIIFDIKDYADDSNRQLKTFVVRFGLRKTIFYILMPLVSVGLFALLAFTISRQNSFITIAFNLIPFIMLLMITWSMHKPHSLLYYLIIIDGLIFLKALCGITGMYFINR